MDFTWICWIFYFVIGLGAPFLCYSYCASILSLTALTQYHLADERSVKDVDPGISQTESKKKSKKHVESSIDSAFKLVRFKVMPLHVMSRNHYKEFDDVFIVLALGYSVFLVCFILHAVAPMKFSKVINDGDIVAFSLGLMSLWKLVKNTALCQFGKSSSRNGDLKLSVIIGILMAAIVFGLLITSSQIILDFEFETVLEKASKSITLHLKEVLPDSTVQLPPLIYKSIISITSGFIGALLLPASVRLARSYYFALSEEEKELRIIDDKLWRRAFLTLDLILPVIITFLWMTPTLSIFSLPSSVEFEGNSPPLSLGIKTEQFKKLRVFFLIVWAVFHLLCFRLHIQAHLNTGIVPWYNELHGTMDQNSDFVKSRLATISGSICKVGLQSLFPATLILTLFGLSFTRGTHLDDDSKPESLLFHPGLLRATFEFLAWWTCSAWSAQTLFVFASLRAGGFQGFFY